MYELVKHRFVPHIHHPPLFKGRSQSMRTKRSQCDGHEAKRSCDSKKQNRHSATMSFRAKSRNLKSCLASADSQAFAPRFEINSCYFQRVRRISNSFFKASPLIACFAESF